MPAAAWAGIAALGDGDLRPLTSRPRRGAVLPRGGAIGAALILVIGGGTWLHRRRGRRDN